MIQYNLDQSCLPHDIRYSEWLERRDWLRVSGQHRRDLIGLVSVCRREKILFCSVLVEREIEGNIKLSAG